MTVPVSSLSVAVTGQKREIPILGGGHLWIIRFIPSGGADGLRGSVLLAASASRTADWPRRRGEDKEPAGRDAFLFLWMDVKFNLLLMVQEYTNYRVILVVSDWVMLTQFRLRITSR